MRRGLVLVVALTLLWAGGAQAAPPERCYVAKLTGTSLPCHRDFRATKQRQEWTFNGATTERGARLYYFLGFPDGRTVLGGEGDDPCVDPVRLRGLVARVHYCLGEPLMLTYRSRGKPVDFRLQFALDR